MRSPRLFLSTQFESNETRRRGAILILLCLKSNSVSLGWSLAFSYFEMIHLYIYAFSYFTRLETQLTLQFYNRCLLHGLEASLCSMVKRSSSAWDIRINIQLAVLRLIITECTWTAFSNQRREEEFLWLVMWKLKRMQISNYVTSIEREIKYHSNTYYNAWKDKL